MDLTPYLDALRADLDRATSLAPDEVRDVALRLVSSLDPALRLTLTRFASDVAAEATSRLDGAVVGVRIVGGEPELVVDRLAAPAPEPPVASEDADDQATSRVSLRLPESLKARADERAATEGVSLNSWLVGVVQQALAASSRPTTVRARGHLSGWA